MRITSRYVLREHLGPLTFALSHLLRHATLVRVKDVASGMFEQRTPGMAFKGARDVGVRALGRLPAGAARLPARRPRAPAGDRRLGEAAAIPIAPASAAPPESVRHPTGADSPSASAASALAAVRARVDDTRTAMNTYLVEAHKKFALVGVPLALHMGGERGSGRGGGVAEWLDGLARRPRQLV
jgi:hypothetical protein